MLTRVGHNSYPYLERLEYYGVLTPFSNSNSHLTNLRRMDSSTSTLLTGPFLIEKIVKIFYKMSVFSANSIDQDQTPRSMASDLGPHCLAMSRLWDATHKWVKYKL